jgi:acyl carrier protein
MTATLIEIAAEVLARKPESVRALAPRESFVGLGGSSMDAVRLVALCERKLGLMLDPARLVGTSPLAEVIAEAREYQAGPGRPAAEDQVREILPGQRDMLMAEVLGGGRSLRNLVSVDLVGPVDHAALEETLQWLVVRHEALRTVFVRHAEAAFSRRVLSACQPHVLRQRLRIAPGDVGAYIVHEQLRAAGGYLIDPFLRPPVAFVLTEFAEQHCLLSLASHHLIADAWALGLMWREMMEHYEAVLAGTPSDRTHRPAPSPDILLARQAQLETTGRLAELTRIRVGQLTGAPTVMELPSQLPRPARPDFRSARLAFGLSDAARQACEDVARRERLTRTVVLLGAWALIVAKRAGVAECLIAGTALQRPSGELMRTVASCVASVPIRCAVSSGLTVGDYLRATSGALSDAVAAADVPFESLVSGLGVANDGRHVPLTQAMFSAHDDFYPQPPESGDLRMEFYEGHFGAAVPDVTLFVQRWHGGPRLVIEYGVSLLLPHEAADLAAAVEETLCRFGTRSAEPLSAVMG